MKRQKLVYRFTTNKEGVWSAGKRLLPTELVDAVTDNRSWLKKPQLPEGDYRFWLTKLGKEKYERTLFLVHKKYLDNIQLEDKRRSDLGEIVYEDEYQVVESLL